MPHIPPAPLSLSLAYACALAAILTSSSSAQVTALDRVPAYGADFGQGVNLGWYDPWADTDLALLAMGGPDGEPAGIGANVLRPGLFEYFLEDFGYDIAGHEFELFARLGQPQQVAIMGYPRAAHRSREAWCDEEDSHLFAGMWEPIWDDGADGTPYNEANPYAAYMYRAVAEYGPEVRFWEIWNEPDFDYRGNGWKTRDFPGNWFDNDIDPCELAIRAPVQAYVRMLRISYEVVKRLRPDDYVAIGGIGSAGFLDAVLRTTDEKRAGAVTPEHPHGGGAYFDALSFHAYPHIDGALREWDNAAGDWAYHRHSDRAVDGFVAKAAQLRAVLAERGFDGSRYPAKAELCTEVNVPRRAFGDENAAFASPRMQANFLTKLLARAQAAGIAQVHPYQLADNTPAGEEDFEFDQMGMYRYIGDVPGDVATVAQRVTRAGIAYRTYGQLLRGAVAEAGGLDALVPEGAATGVAFRLPDGEAAYLLWARTSTDGSEDAQGAFELPGTLAGGAYVVLAQDFSVTDERQSSGARLAVGGDPVYLYPVRSLDGASDVGETAVSTGLHLAPNPAAEHVMVHLPAKANSGSLYLRDATGRLVSEAHVRGARVSLDVSARAPGVYVVEVRSGGASLASRLTVRR